MNCKNCGAELDEGALFCRKCGTAVPPEPAPKPIKQRSQWNLRSLMKRYPKLLPAIGIGALALIVLVIVIVSVASSKGADRFRSPEEVQNAVVAALEDGDGSRLYAMTKTSEALLGQHPDTFGEGDTPKAVMQGYYRTLAESLKSRLSEQYGKGFRLEMQAETQLLSGSDVFEANRALGVDAPQYALITGTLYVEGEPVSSISMTAAEIDGEWKLLVVYLY